MNLDLIRKLRLWDGVHIEYLTELYEANSSSIDFFENLVAICINEQDLQNGLLNITFTTDRHYQILLPKDFWKFVKVLKIGKQNFTFCNSYHILN